MDTKTIRWSSAFKQTLHFACDRRKRGRLGETALLQVIRQSPQQTTVCTPKLRIDKYYMRTFGVQPLGCLFLFKATDVLHFNGDYFSIFFFRCLTKVFCAYNVMHVTIMIVLLLTKEIYNEKNDENE